ncbi:MAG: response regulator [Candidatus Zixiibacteriota bacterium]
MTTPAERTILVVDDEEDVRSFLELALREAGFRVITAADGNEALEAVKKSLPDLISLDLVMPKKSGAKFYRELTKNKQWAKIPIIIVTGHARDDLGKADLKELTMSGPGIYIEKPVRPERYVAAVKNILGLAVTDEEKTHAEHVNLQNRLKDIIDSADTETLKKLKDILDLKIRQKN